MAIIEQNSFGSLIILHIFGSSEFFQLTFEQVLRIAGQELFYSHSSLLGDESHVGIEPFPELRKSGVSPVVIAFDLNGYELSLFLHDIVNLMAIDHPMSYAGTMWRQWNNAANSETEVKRENATIASNRGMPRILSRTRLERMVTSSTPIGSVSS